jgi:hypothetical protein
MKRLGVVGGIGPESTIAYYRLIIAAVRERWPDHPQAPVLINSIDVQKVLRLAAENALPALTDYLVSELEPRQPPRDVDCRSSPERREGSHLRLADADEFDSFLFMTRVAGRPQCDKALSEEAGIAPGDGVLHSWQNDLQERLGRRCALWPAFETVCHRCPDFLDLILRVSPVTVLRRPVELVVPVSSLHHRHIEPAKMLGNRLELLIRSTGQPASFT